MSRNTPVRGAPPSPAIVRLASPGPSSQAQGRDAAGAPDERMPADAPAANGADPEETIQTTKERIFAAAEKLFAERGFEGASLRAVTGAAGVNLAAVNYHFGSKQALLRAVIDRHAGPVNQERLEHLERLYLGAPPGPQDLEAILEAFVVPAIVRLAPSKARGTQIRRLVGRLYGEPVHLVAPLLEQEFGEVGRRFQQALAAALPELDPDELRWRFQFSLGALVHVISGNAELLPGTPGLDTTSDLQQLSARLVGFLAAGLRAPVPSSASKETSE